MATEGRLDVILFALTGFGNPVLEALLKDNRVNLQAVFTIKYDTPFPHYAERQLLELCQEKQVVCYHNVKVGSEEGIGLLHKHSPDLIIVATFKQILKRNVITLPSLGIVNFHPSLLPHYRGPCPSNAALLNDDAVTGVTVHYVTEGLDEGDILLQRFLDIGEQDNDGILRKKLARLSGEMIPELVDLFSGFTKPIGISQAHAAASLAPKPTVEDGYLESTSEIENIRRKMRALNPLPGTSIQVGAKRIPVDRFDLSTDSRLDGLYESETAVDIVRASHAIRLYKQAN